MANDESRSDTEPLRQLYPQLKDDELQLADETIEAYLALVRRIYDRVIDDPAAYARLRADLTALRAQQYDEMHDPS